MMLLKEYIVANKIYAIAIGYFLIAILLERFSNISITPPCLSVLLLDVKCPGCGLTRAFIHMLNLDFALAWKSNFLALIITPILLVLFILNLLQFRKEYQASAEEKDI